MIIRKAKKEDLEKIALLMKEEFGKPPFNEKAAKNDVLKSLNFYFKIGKIFLAEENKIIGVIVFKIEQYWKGETIIIEDLAIDDKFKNKGIGRLLMNYVEDFAKKDKIKLILFKTNKKSSSRKLYKRLGYKINKNIIYFEKKI